MELELRNKNGEFIVSFRGIVAPPIFRFLLNDTRLTLGIKKIKGEVDSCRIFENKTTESINGSNDLVYFVIRPGDYVKIINV